MMTFDAAVQLFNTARNPTRGKPIGNNTLLQRINAHTFGIRLHSTTVVQIHSDGSYTLNSGGYKTHTTKKRINEYSPASVYQKKFEWYLGDGGKFSDGVKIGRNGRPVS